MSEKFRSVSVHLQTSKVLSNSKIHLCMCIYIWLLASVHQQFKLGPKKLEKLDVLGNIQSISRLYTHSKCFLRTDSEEGQLIAFYTFINFNLLELAFINDTNGNSVLEWAFDFLMAEELKKMKHLKILIFFSLDLKWKKYILID